MQPSDTLTTLDFGGDLCRLAGDSQLVPEVNWAKCCEGLILTTQEVTKPLSL